MATGKGPGAKLAVTARELSRVQHLLSTTYTPVGEDALDRPSSLKIHHNIQISATNRW